MEYIAHIRQSDGNIQSVSQHLHEVRLLCEQFGEKINAKHLSGLTGLLHDLGKNTEAFRHYIQEAVANPDHRPPKGSVDHSTAGGKFIYQRYHEATDNALVQMAAEWISMCILSHHGGLLDFITPEQTSPFLNRVTKQLDEYEHAVSTFLSHQMGQAELDQYFQQAVEETKHLLILKKQRNLRSIVHTFILKFLFSCLIDADRTNSRMFEDNESTMPSFDHIAFFEKCYKVLMDKLESFKQRDDAEHPINQLRRKMSDECEAFASRPSGIYTLSIPTGGGKTLASLRFALKHALEHGKERIIYVVPYTTIIEQNAEEVRKLIRDWANVDECLLEHHSNVIDERVDADEWYDVRLKKLRLARDNWDSPIIFTTMVQFLNVFFAKGTRNVRRLHHLANAVIIFDEVQSVPIKCISLFNETLNFLSSYARTSIVLCTATQPALDFVQRKLHLPPGSEMVRNMQVVSKEFKRVELVDLTSESYYDAKKLAAFAIEQLREVNNLLVILNTRSAVRKLFAALKREKDLHDYELFHLSTYMCPAHRKDVLDKVRKALHAEGKKVICVSTQLIEAGVDISFECVIRSLAGLDSIAQAAGRCNRHGKDKLRYVYLIRSSDEDLTRLHEIKVAARQTERILYEFRKDPDRFGNDLLSREAMTLYFQYYYHEMQTKLNYQISDLKQDAIELLDMNKNYCHAWSRKTGKRFPLLNRQSFATVEQHFKVIDQPTEAILVPYNQEAKDLITDLNGELKSGQLTSLLRRAQQYVINIYDHERSRLDRSGYIDLLLNGSVYALKEVAYHKEYGLDMEGDAEWSLELV